jgi:hypothetical protein
MRSRTRAASAPRGNAVGTRFVRSAFPHKDGKGGREKFAGVPLMGNGRLRMSDACRNADGSRSVWACEGCVEFESL